ncbi:hypothetical protein HNR46_001688 [Haloferula luteola]|uniref:Uncharacterized protein n=1 Tax=Haloferula luteola TaxID=595692 RepID=A0A840V0B7_9BACT|nr:hypothetical protein [Haloferula luteola]MBB5351452.1 hypothetical protein [Haloferula luteola]
MPAPSDQSDPGLAGTPFVVEGTGQWTSLHFVRSSEITGKAEMSPSEIDRLQRAVEIFGDEWDSGALIFDSDALSSSTIPLVLFAEEGCDLTEQVKSIYEQLLAEEGSSKEER